MDRTTTELGAFLRARRADRAPADAGLPGGGRRRAPGLRREELAALAGVSVDYLVRLEQGRQHEPSAEVLRALADALGLVGDARRHLFALAGRIDRQPVDPAVREVPPSLRRLVVAAHPAPAWVVNRRRDIVAWNPAAEALLGEIAPVAHHLHLVFGDRAALWADPALVAQDTVASMRAATAEVRDHPAVAGLVREMATAYPAFARLWARQDVRTACSPARTVRHPQAGELCFDVALLDAGGGDLQLVVFEPQDRSRERWAAYVDGRTRDGQRLQLA